MSKSHILMPVIGYNIKKNLKNWLKEKSKNVDVRSRNVILHHIGHNIICSQKIGFTCLLNHNYVQKIRKKSMRKSWENYSCSHIKPCYPPFKIIPFPPFLKQFFLTLPYKANLENFIKEASNCGRTELNWRVLF